jgi:hypothetical protein
MATDPPYGVNLEPEWREEVGLNPLTRQGGKVSNDDRVDWSAAYALFPGDVAYVWHAGVHAAEVAVGLYSCEFQIRGADHLEKAAFRHLPGRLSLGPRALLVRRTEGKDLPLAG